MGDNILHCNIKRELQESCEVINDFTVTQTDFDGMSKLIHWLEGFQAAKGGTIPGHHELLMFHRGLANHVYKSRNSKHP